MSALVETKNLKKYFDTPRGTLHAVDDVSLAIEEGTTLGVVGESGCGKSTLGRTILHILESTDGSIRFAGEDVTRVTPAKLRELREQMQIIFQDPYSSLDPRMTVEEIIQEPLLISRRFTKAQLEREADELMELVGIDRRLRLAYPTSWTAGAGSGSASPGPWLSSRSSWSATSRCPPWTSPSRRRCSTCCRTSRNNGN
jgi:peptide/nickel transport system ATP-binding protein